MSKQEVQRINGLYGFEFRDVDRRMVPEGQKRKWNIKRLWQRNHEIVNLAVQGFKNKDIALILNIDPQTVSDTLNSDLGRQKLSEMRKGRDEEAKKTAEKIRTIADKALNIYHELFDDDSGQVSLKDKGNFAGEFLKEISGLRAPTKIQSQSMSMVLTPEELEAFKKRGQAAINGEEFIDAEVVDDSQPISSFENRTNSEENS